MTILEKHPGSRQVSWPNQFVTGNDEGVPACHMAFWLPQLETRQGAVEALSLLQLYDYGVWRLELRISYPKQDAAAAQQIRAFHSAFPWKASSAR